MLFKDEWPLDRIEHLKQAWANGLSQSQIAAQINVSRNAVAGKLSRLGLKRGRMKKDTTERPERKHTRLRVGPRPQRVRLTDPEPLEAPREALHLVIDQLTFTEGGPGECRYMTGPETYCGLPPARKGSPWCSTHRKVTIDHIMPIRLSPKVTKC